MAVDYDARHRDSDQDVQELEELKAASATRTGQQPDVEPDEAEIAEAFELPGADLSGESLTVRVDPQQVDEFTCAACFLVRHHTQLALPDQMLCRDCA
jgi:hypothetical protein